MKRMITILMLLIGISGMAQSLLTVSGIVMENTPVGQPIPNQEITIDVYAGGALYASNVVYSNTDGVYEGYFQMNFNQGEVVISTEDCDSSLVSYTHAFFGDSLFVYQAFSICSNQPPGCMAYFNYVIQEPLTVNFLNLSQGDNLTYDWSFGDGSYSNEENPVHTYQIGGYYNICLTIMNNDSTCYDVFCNQVLLGNDTTGCQANYTYFPLGDSSNPNMGNMSVQFLHLSLGNPAIWLWQFGDGTASSEPNPIHTFNSPGIYNVCLTIESVDSICTSTFCQDVIIQNDSVACIAQFVYYPADSMQSGLDIQFADLSYGNPANWFWDFGDGTSSNEQNPTHTFSVEGYYYVCLTISSPDCQSTWCESVWVGETNDCFNYFSYQTVDNTVVFSGTHSSNVPSSYFWEFGDGTSGMGQQITHTFNGPGMYYVSLYTTDDNMCEANSSQMVVVGDSIVYNQVYGQVFEGDFPMTEGFVMIYSLDTSMNYMPFFDAVMLDSSGIYVFPYVPNGEFLVYAIGMNFDNYLPTYFGDVLNWEEATLVVLGQSNNPYDIHMVSATTTSVGGNGTIEGQISNGMVKTAGFLDKINMLLYNEYKESLGYASVSADGDFNMDNLAYGVYYLYPELSGVSAQFIRVELSSEQPNAEVKMTFANGSITGINDPMEIVQAGDIYPNPVADLLKINLSSKQMSHVTLTITGIDGRVHYTSSMNVNKGAEEIQISVSDLPKGMFILQITDNNQVYLNRKFIR